MYAEPHESRLYHERPNPLFLCDYFESAATFGPHLTRQGTDLLHNLFQAQCLAAYLPQGHLKESLFMHLFFSFSGIPSFDISFPEDSNLYAKDIKV